MNIAVRRAVQLAYDYSGSLKVIRDGGGVIASGVLPADLPCRPALPTSTQNLAEAKAILAKAGIKDLHLTMNYQTYDSLQVADATLLQSNLKQIGVTLQLVPLEFPVYLSDLSNVSSIPQMMLAEDFAPFPDVGVMLANYYTGASLGISNRTGFDDATVNSLIGAALSSTSSAAACQDYVKAQRLIYNAALAVNMLTIDQPVAYASWLKGVWSHQAPGGLPTWIPDLRVS